MNLVGLGIVVRESATTSLDRPWVLTVGVAMMVGGVGLRTLIGASTKNESADRSDERGS